MANPKRALMKLTMAWWLVSNLMMIVSAGAQVVIDMPPPPKKPAPVVHGGSPSTTVITSNAATAVTATPPPLLAASSPAMPEPGMVALNRFAHARIGTRDTYSNDGFWDRRGIRVVTVPRIHRQWVWGPVWGGWPFWRNCW